MCCLSLEKWSWTACKEKDFRISDARIIVGLGSLSWALSTLFLDKCPHFKSWCKQLWGWGAYCHHHHSLLRSSCHGRARAVCQSSEAGTKLSAADLEAMLLTLCPLPSIPEYTTERFKRHFWRQKSLFMSYPLLVSRLLSALTLGAPIWEACGVRYSGTAFLRLSRTLFWRNQLSCKQMISFGIQSISMSHCILLPPC